MKKVLFAVSSICLAAAAAMAPLSVFAAEACAVPEYPDDIFESLLVFKNLTDFAVASDNQMLFIDDGALVHWENEIRTVYTFESPVTDIDCVDSTFYYSSDGGETSYILPYPVEDKLPEESEPVEHVYPTENEINVFDGYYYYYNTNGILVGVDKNSDQMRHFDNFVKAKVYNGQLYGIYKNTLGHFLHTIDGLSNDPLDITYSNYNRLTTISAGNVPEELTQLNDTPQFVQINSDALLTRLDIDNLVTYDDGGNRYFSVIEPNETHEYLKGKAALLLCEEGNVRIVAYGKNAYIVKSDCTTDINYDALSPVSCTATVNVVGEFAHSLPFMSNATRTFAIAPNEEVSVLFKMSKDSGNLAHDFYLIQNSEGKLGYVAFEYLNLNQPPVNEGQPSDKDDPNPQTGDSVKIVILVIVVIALVLTAVGYLTWVSTSGKRKTVKNKNDGEIELNDNSTENYGKK